MPYTLQNAAKLFQWQTVGGIPATLSEPTQLGDGYYVMICPLCSGIHEVRRDAHGQHVPGCVTTPEAYTHQRENWLRRFPQARDHRAIYILAEGEAVDAPLTIAEPPAQPVKAKRRKVSA